MHYILFHNSFDKIAGTERVLYNIISYLAGTPDARLTLLLASPKKPLALPLDAFSIDIVFLDVDSNGLGFMDLIKYHSKLYTQLTPFFKGLSATEKLICIATNPALAALAYYAGNRNGQRSLAVVSCEHFALDVAGRLSKVIRQILYKKVSVVVLTERDKDEIVKRYQPKLCVCIPNAIPFPLRPYEYEPGKKKILAVGRLTAQKGFDLLLRSYALIAGKYPEWSLDIVGDNYGDRRLLEDLKKELDLKNANLLPATTGINAHYEEASFFVLSSRFEGLPMVMLEAMGYGLPIVAFDCPTGPAELVNDTNGFLVKNGDLVELANCMEELMVNKDLLLSKAAGAEKRALNYTKDHINKLWKEFLDKV
jgi:glycosyltransferase involved in cell wall biosynthesis